MAMFEISFKEVATHVSGKPLDIPEDGLTVDFDKIGNEPEMAADLVGAAHIFIMAHSWIALKKRENEGG